MLNFRIGRREKILLESLINVANVEKDSFQNVAVHHIKGAGKCIFRQANIMLMADVSVCNRDKDGASAFITIPRKMLVSIVYLPRQCCF